MEESGRMRATIYKITTIDYICADRKKLGELKGEI
jgi:hypothetical protein